MKKFFYLLVLFSLLVLPLAAQQSKVVIDERTQQLLRTLDHLVEHKADYHNQRIQQAARLQEQAQRTKGYNRINLLREVFDLYSHFQTDSAQTALNQIMAMPEFKADPKLQASAHIAQGELYAVSALYVDAEKELAQVPTELINDNNAELRLYYFRVQRMLYGWMADYNKIATQHEQFNDQAMRYRDSLLLFTHKHGKDRDIVLADKLLAQNHPQEAINTLKKYPQAVNEQNPDAYVCFILSQAYRAMKRSTEEAYYLTLTAIADLKRPTTEYQALPILTQLLYESGDVTRAYTYLLCSMEDASYCKAGLRSVETSSIFPIINKRYKELEREQSHRNQIFLYSLVAGLVMLLLLVFYLRKQMRKLHALQRKQAEGSRRLAEGNAKMQETNEKMQAAMAQLQEANDKLQATYNQLQMTDKVKEEYIARYLDRCRGYLDALAEHRRSALRMLKEKKVQELYDSLQDENNDKREQEEFYIDFDTAFLTLFPHFVYSFNKLLSNTQYTQPRYKDQLNTSLRIFALIRLGVTDNARIAHFLNISLATAYAYRSKIRNLAIGDPNKLEEEVSKL